MSLHAHTLGPAGHQTKPVGVHVSPGWASAPAGRRWYGVRFSSIDHLVVVMRPSSVVAMDNLPAFLDHPVGRTRSGVPLRIGRTLHIQANGEPPTRVSVAFGNSEEQLRRRNRRETNEPSDEIRCTSLSEFLSRVVNPVCLPHQRLDAGTHVRMSSIPFLAHLHAQRDSHSPRTRHHRTQFKQSRGRLLACSALDQVRT
jgi:hypothetical protein